MPVHPQLVSAVMQTKPEVAMCRIAIVVLFFMQLHASRSGLWYAVEY